MEEEAFETPSFSLTYLGLLGMGTNYLPGHREQKALGGTVITGRTPMILGLLSL